MFFSINMCQLWLLKFCWTSTSTNTSSVASWTLSPNMEDSWKLPLQYHIKAFKASYHHETEKNESLDCLQGTSGDPSLFSEKNWSFVHVPFIQFLGMSCFGPSPRFCTKSSAFCPKPCNASRRTMWLVVFGQQECWWNCLQFGLLVLGTLERTS